MDGIAYATDASGTVIAYGASKWNEFAAANGGLRLVRPEAVLGRSILDVITGEQVRVAYRHFLAALAENRVGAIRFSYRCDGPGAGRAMQMSITRLRWGGEPAGFLFQSTLLDRGARTGHALRICDGLDPGRRRRRDRELALQLLPETVPARTGPRQSRQLDVRCASSGRRPSGRVCGLPELRGSLQRPRRQ
jgi:hypothetical protein